MKREAGCVVLGLILAFAVTGTYFQLVGHVGNSAANQILMETTARADASFVRKTAFTPTLSATVFVAALVCACFVYSVSKKRLR